MLGFCLSRLQDYNFDGLFSFNTQPGDWLYFHEGLFRYGMIVHLAGCLPAGLLAVLQFTPIIRHKFILFHRMVGYVTLVLVLISNIGAIIIIRRPAGGDISKQTILALLVILTTLSAVMALWNIRVLQIDQHRAWMLRLWFYMGTIITLRIIAYTGAAIITRIGGFYAIWSCEKIDFTYRQFGVTGILEKKYPQCLSTNGTLDGQTVVPARFDLTEPEAAGASSNVMFGAGVSPHYHFFVTFNHIHPFAQMYLLD
jgi:uncharacterized membrane protein